jgi:hypothetical protein
MRQKINWRKLQEAQNNIQFYLTNKESDKLTDKEIESFNWQINSTCKEIKSLKEYVEIAKERSLNAT